MAKIDIVNVKKASKSGVRFNYIGHYNHHYRLPSSPIQNPFVIGVDGDRETTLQKYRDWLCQKLYIDDSPQRREIIRLWIEAREKGSLTLGCWCAPKACHGDVVKELLEQHL